MLSCGLGRAERGQQRVERGPGHRGGRTGDLEALALGGGEGPVQRGLGRLAGQSDRGARGPLEAERRRRAGRGLGRLQEPGHPHPGDRDPADPGPGAAHGAALGAVDRDPQPAGGAGRDVQLLGRPGHRGGGVDVPGGGGDGQPSGHRARDVIQQLDVHRRAHVHRVVEVDLQPLPGGLGRALDPGRVRVAVEGVDRVTLRVLPQPGSGRGGGDALWPRASTATVWWPAVQAGSSCRGAPPAAPSGSSGGLVPVAV